MAEQLAISEHEVDESGPNRLQKFLYRIVYRNDTPAGRLFDMLLMAAILCSVLVIMLDTVESWHREWGTVFQVIEWGMTVLFTLEYAARLYCVRDSMRYARSFYGVVDLLSIVPAYLSLLFSGSEYLLVIRVLRILRIFRLLKLLRYVQSGSLIMSSLYDSRHKIIVFYVFVIVLVTIFGSVLYVIEGPENGFTSIPKAIYWAVVTVTTTGYGDITPKTAFGEFLASLVMITGYVIIAVPTGIFAAEMLSNMRRRVDARQCSSCGEFGHELDARYCHHCGKILPT